MKTSFLPLLLGFTISLSALAQTSSRFRNEVTNNINEHDQRIRNTCTALAKKQYNAQDVRLTSPRSWLYTYEVKFLNDCYFNVKMRLMDNHIRLAQTRIGRLKQQVKNNRDATLSQDVKALEQGLVVFKDRQKEERTRYQENNYGWFSMDNITQLLLREIKTVLVEYYEMRAEMRFERTL